MSKKDELFEKIKKMNLDECWVYHSSAKTTNNFIGLFGVATCLLMIAIPSLLTVIPGLILLYILGNLSSGISITLQHLEERITKLDPNDK